MRPAYHYSDLAHLPFILRDGHIKVSRHIRAKVCPDVPPGVCWFTWDRRLDPSTAAAHNGGAAPRRRLITSTNALLRWQEACLRAGWSLMDVELAAYRGRACGARVDAWRASCEPVSLALIEDIQILRPGGVWRSMGEPAFRVEGNIAAISYEGMLFGVRRTPIAGLGTMAYAIKQEFERAPGDAAVLRSWLEAAA
jgi:hypothetical protein